MSNTVTKRFLVLDRTNTAMRPCDHGVALPDLQGPKSPSFLKAASAKAFADILSKRHPGQKFYLVEVMSGVVQYTEPAEAGDWQDATDADENE